ncbi:MAG: acyltransferase family protein [Armatimonadota bacterium]
MNERNNSSEPDGEISGNHYRPNIDGLRAIAVLLVLLFHANVAFPGGYVGVDVFFVISGYLITSLILRDVAESKFSFYEFWKRRTRRIIPASATMVLVVLVCGSFLLFPSDYLDLGKVALFQNIGLSNIYFWKSIGYFSGESDLKPMLHTWSLAVEEQFYLFYPWFLVNVLRFARKRTWIAMSIVVVLSLIFCEVVLKSHKLAAFYLLPSRAWEMLIGGMACFLPIIKSRKAWVCEMMSWIALAAIFVVALTYNEFTRFPGINALAPCIASVTLLYVSEQQLTSVHKILSLSPLVFVGKISYSLYLWHWPVLAFWRYWSDKPITKLEGCLLLVLSAVVAYFSWRYIELPVRSGSRSSNLRTTFIKFGVLLSLIAVAAGVIVSFGGIPGRVPADAVRYANTKKSMDMIHEVTLESAQVGLFPQLGDKSSNETCILWGDSHAMSIAPALNSVCRTSNIKLVQATHSSTPPILNFDHTSKYGLNEGTIEFNQKVLDYIKVIHPRYVVIAGDWATYSGQSDFESKLLYSLAELRKVGTKVVFVLDVAKQDVDVPSYLAKRAFWNLPEKTKGVSDVRHRQRNERVEEVLRRNATALVGIEIFDPSTCFVDEQRIWRFMYDGKVMYRDRSHLSLDGAKRLEPLIRTLLTH